MARGAGDAGGSVDPSGTTEAPFTIDGWAAREGYVRPVVDDEAVLEIRRGRHPVARLFHPWCRSFVHAIDIDLRLHQKNLRPLPARCPG